MNKPFTLNLQLVEKNYNDSTPIIGQSVYPIRLTLRHTAQDIFNSIWTNSPDYQLKPLFLRLKYQGQSLPGSPLSEVLSLEEVEDEVNDITLEIDYTLFGNRNIPSREPEEELFDIFIQWISQGAQQKIQIRESLGCTIGVLKDYVAEERNKTAEVLVDGSYFQLKYFETQQFCDNDLRMSDVIGLDVRPFHPVIFELSYSERPAEPEPEPEPEPELPRRIRFFINVNSNINNLQQERSLFELDAETTLRDFTNSVISRIDQFQVRRTFFEQIKLTYNQEMISIARNYNELMKDLIDDADFGNGKIYTMALNVHEHLSGVDGGILSRQFLNDLTSNNFEFHPRPNDEDLLISRQTLSQNNRQDHGVNSTPNLSGNAGTQAETNGGQPTTNNQTNANDLMNSNSQEQNNQVDVTHGGELDPITSPSFRRYEPTRIVLHNGVEWNLTGETYEMVEVNPLSVNSDHRPRQLLVNQSDLSSVVYEFTNDQGVTVALNSSQCIVVEPHGYIILNASGAAKLHRHFELQQVQVNFYDPPPPNATPTTPADGPNRNGFENLDNIFSNLFNANLNNANGNANVNANFNAENANINANIFSNLFGVADNINNANPENNDNNDNNPRNNNANLGLDLLNIMNNMNTLNGGNGNNFPILRILLLLLKWSSAIIRLFRWSWNSIRRLDRNFFYFILRIVVIVFVFKLDKLLYQPMLLGVLVILSLLYIIVFYSEKVIERLERLTIDDQHRRSIRDVVVQRIRMIQVKRETVLNKLVKQLVHVVLPRRDYEYLLIQHNRADTTGFYVQENLANLGRDLFLLLSTFLPSIVKEIEAEKTKRLLSEVEDLREEVLQSIDRYEQLTDEELRLDISLEEIDNLTRPTENRTSETSEVEDPDLELPQIQDPILEDPQLQAEAPNEAPNDAPDDTSEDAPNDSPDTSAETVPEINEEEVRERKYQLLLEAYFQINDRIKEITT
ncbi:hypothetical protein CLIB1444_01S06612 [[Candida] jaroonii]|uniref:Uncharacterized protein n=1 Tax=[Candida] jaroonii TaxID=467808 RepID=A0ACA9Y0L7_9ASCO|nr:hypothetical protein CLIB1444_01S06612 [[Candida] jaroonii]